MSFAGSPGRDDDGFRLDGPNLVEGFRRCGYKTNGSGAVSWFDSTTETGSVLSQSFEEFLFAGNTWNLETQLACIDERLSQTPKEQPRFVFLNVGETHVPYWHQGAAWDRWPSPCVPFESESVVLTRAVAVNGPAWSGLMASLNPSSRAFQRALC